MKVPSSGGTYMSRFQRKVKEQRVYFLLPAVPPSSPPRDPETAVGPRGFVTRLLVLMHFLGASLAPIHYPNNGKYKGILAPPTQQYKYVSSNDK